MAKGFGKSPRKQQRKPKPQVDLVNGEWITLPSGKLVYRRPLQEILQEIQQSLRIIGTPDVFFSMFTVNDQVLTEKSAKLLSDADRLALGDAGQRLKREIQSG